MNVAQSIQTAIVIGIGVAIGLFVGNISYDAWLWRHEAALERAYVEFD